VGQTKNLNYHTNTYQCQTYAIQKISIYRTMPIHTDTNSNTNTRRIQYKPTLTLQVPIRVPVQTNQWTHATYHLRRIGPCVPFDFTTTSELFPFDFTTTSELFPFDFTTTSELFSIRFHYYFRAVFHSISLLLQSWFRPSRLV
jgi:hypothetical protein